jgi:hypothetical protein
VRSRNDLTLTTILYLLQVVVCNSTSVIDSGPESVESNQSNESIDRSQRCILLSYYACDYKDLLPCHVLRSRSSVSQGNDYGADPLMIWLSLSFNPASSPPEYKSTIPRQCGHQRYT